MTARWTSAILPANGQGVNVRHWTNGDAAQLDIQGVSLGGATDGTANEWNEVFVSTRGGIGVEGVAARGAFNAVGPTITAGSYTAGMVVGDPINMADATFELASGYFGARVHQLTVCDQSMVLAGITLYLVAGAFTNPDRSTLTYADLVGLQMAVPLTKTTSLPDCDIWTMDPSLQGLPVFSADSALHVVPVVTADTTGPFTATTNLFTVAAVTTPFQLA